MGLIFSRFFRDKPSTRDRLERIEQEIQNIEESRLDKIKRKQFFSQILSFIPITILIATLCFLIYPSDKSWRDKLLLCVPVIILNLSIWSFRKCIQWYSEWSLENEQQRLRKLRKEKKRIIDMVCETESYRVASELLEKYDPKQLRRRDSRNERPTSPMNSSLTKFSASPIRPKVPTQPVHNPAPFLNQSINYSLPTPPIVQVPAAPPPTPVSKPSARANVTLSSPHNTSIASPSVAASSVQGRPVRPILSKDRSRLEKFIDWVIADGPDNRFALICRFCYGHNGMSLAEEYETINFRCCYCYNLNTASQKHRQLHDQLQPEREKLVEKAEEDKTVSDKVAVPKPGPDNSSSTGPDIDVTSAEEDPKEAVKGDDKKVNGAEDDVNKKD